MGLQIKVREKKYVPSLREGERKTWTERRAIFIFWEGLVYTLKKGRVVLFAPPNSSFFFSLRKFGAAVTWRHKKRQRRMHLNFQCHNAWITMMLKMIFWQIFDRKSIHWLRKRYVVGVKEVIMHFGILIQNHL